MARNFEYMRALSFSFYQARDSFLHRLDPRAKLLSFFSLLICVALTAHLFGLLFALMLVLLGFLLAKIPLRDALHSLLAPLPFIIFLAILQFWFHPRQTTPTLLWQIGSIQIFDVQALAAARLIGRFVVLLLLIHLMMSVLSSLELLYALQSLLQPLQKMSISTSGLVMSVQIMLRFLPLLAQRMEYTAKSQAARGADWDSPKGGLFKRVRLFLPLLVPLFLSSLRQSERVAEAMLARAYDGRRKRTMLQEFQFGWSDFFFLLVIVVSCAWIIYPWGLV